MSKALKPLVFGNKQVFQNVERKTILFSFSSVFFSLSPSFFRAVCSLSPNISWRHSWRAKHSAKRRGRRGHYSVYASGSRMCNCRPPVTGGCSGLIDLKTTEAGRSRRWREGRRFQPSLHKLPLTVRPFVMALDSHSTCMAISCVFPTMTSKCTNDNNITNVCIWNKNEVR